VILRFLDAFYLPEKRSIMFYSLAFAPLLLFAYWHLEYPLALITPAFGFLLLLFKKSKLFNFVGASRVQKSIGLAIILASFFLYYPLVNFHPTTVFYSVANYAAFVVGLFLTFFESSALKEALTPVLVIIAAALNTLLFNSFELFLSQYINHFISLMTLILRSLKMNITTQYPNTIVLNTSNGPIPAVFSWGCVASSSIVFSIILVVFLLEETAQPRPKLLWAIVGILGTFSVNILRVTIIFLSWQFYGFETGEKVHLILGYTLFITWLTLFLCTFTKRQVILTQIKSIPHRLRSMP